MEIADKTNFVAASDRPLYEARHFINGVYTAGSTGRTFKNIDPVTGSQTGIVHEGLKPEVDAAVAAARLALQGEWGRMSLSDRSARLHAVADGINSCFDKFLAAEVSDTGKPCTLARHVDIPRGAANFRVFADLVKQVSTESFALDTPDGQGALNYALRKPKGVVAVISPWNLPLLLMTWKVGPALACGNTVVVKPSEETPRTAALLGEVINEAGIPAGVFNVVHGFGADSAGEFLSSHPDVDGITFTGETRTGESIMQSAAIGLRHVSLECGGKNAGIVFADCDMDKAVAGTLRSVFANCGQVCLCTERLYVERPIFDEFVARLKAGAEALKLGYPDDPDTDMGPLISQGHRDKVLHYCKLAQEEGATLITGGGVPDLGESLKGGAWMQPTIWTGLAETACVVKEEIFGPVCHIQPFDTEAEAVQMANDTRYGLAAAVWSENLSRAHRVSARLAVGIAWVNCWFQRDLRTPFGGMGHSGIGREGGIHSLEFYSELTNVCVKL